MSFNSRYWVYLGFLGGTTFAALLGITASYVARNLTILPENVFRHAVRVLGSNTHVKRELGGVAADVGAVKAYVRAGSRLPVGSERLFVAGWPAGPVSCMFALWLTRCVAMALTESRLGRPSYHTWRLGPWKVPHRPRLPGIPQRPFPVVQPERAVDVPP